MGDFFCSCSWSGGTSEPELTQKCAGLWSSLSEWSLRYKRRSRIVTLSITIGTYKWWIQKWYKTPNACTTQKNRKHTTVRHASKQLCLARKRFRCVVKPHSEISYAPSGLQSTVFSQNQYIYIYRYIYIYISFFNLFLLHRRIQLCGSTALKSRVRPSPSSIRASFICVSQKKEKKKKLWKGRGHHL